MEAGDSSQIEHYAVHAKVRHDQERKKAGKGDRSIPRQGQTGNLPR